MILTMIVCVFTEFQYFRLESEILLRQQCVSKEFKGLHGS